ncbi:TonB-dependent receptor [Paradesertivirga mongoliensis]|uniref:TonB-dependent receptor n=1 Tax=Paradesertivirga mongoliensis TaxID=2100740 RepID=A0ABW4ZSJ9_9SPHI|nr:TonB-dependent receptor [Pedobacter mongoliensis]
MKLITFLIFAGAMQIHAAGYSQRSFNLSETNTTVKEMLRKIEKTSDYTVFYRHDQINLNQKVTVFADNSTVGEVMKQVLQNQPLTFEVVDKMIVIKSTASQNAQDYTITGTVTDESGEALPGASVKLKGTNIGVTTDINGAFALNVPGEAGATLVISYLGFKQQEIAVSVSQRSVQVRLATDAAALEEVVVIGYGTVRKRDLTGSVASVKAEDIVQAPTHNAIEAIQGRVAGVDITRATGAAGGGANITIRGNKSIATKDKMAERNAPLYIIDGFQGGDISTLNTNDIESIEVLKDASSTAIYGAQGANGVIIVTTKKGSAGKARVSYSSYFGVNKYTFPESRTGEDYLNLRREAWKNAPSGSPTWTGPQDDPLLFDIAGEYAAVQAGQWVDWVDLVVQDGTQQSHTISVNGGSEKTKVFASAGYFKEEGMLRNNEYNRYNGRFNVDQIISKWAKAGILSQVTYNNQNNRRDPLSVASSITPLGVPYDEFGMIRTYPIDFDRTRISPLADERTEFVARDNNIRTNVIANGYLELTPLKGLTFRSNFGSNLDFNRRGVYNDATSLAQNSSKTSFTSSSTQFRRYLNWDNILTYNRTIADDHNLTLTGITSYLREDNDNLSASGTNQLLPSQLFYNLNGTSVTGRNISSPYIKWENMAYAGRLNYSYKGKYLLTLTGRYDGASRLADGNKWAFFPSAAIGWNVSEESFMSSLEEISNLKLRASYGVSGNYVIDPYGTQSGLTYSTRMSFGEISAPMYGFNATVGNPELGWESSATTNFGLDLGLLNDRITLTADVYSTKTSDILYKRSLPQSTGVVDVLQNIASTSNRGFELAITSRNVQGPAFKWNSTLTFSRNKEKITGLLDGRNILATAAERESLLLGHPINSFYTYKKLGIWQTHEAEEAAKYRVNSATGNQFKPGDIKLQDLNGDFIIDATNDRTFIGSTVPDWVGGLQNNFSYKGIDLGVFVFARYGQMLDAEFLGRYNPGGLGNGPAFINYWTPENPTNDFPRPRKNEANLTNYQGYQTLNFTDGSYFKIKNVTLGYTLPKKVSQRFLVDNLRIYATGYNLLTVAKSHLVQDYDPERGGSESSPLSRQFVFGINLGL